MGLRIGKQIANSVCLVYAHLDSPSEGADGSNVMGDGTRLAVLWKMKPSDIDTNLLQQLEEGKGYRLTSGVIPDGATGPLNGCFAWRHDGLVMIFRIDHDNTGKDEKVAGVMARALGMPSGLVVTIP